MSSRLLGSIMHQCLIVVSMCPKVSQQALKLGHASYDGLKLKICLKSILSKLRRGNHFSFSGHY